MNVADDAERVIQVALGRPETIEAAKYRSRTVEAVRAPTREDTPLAAITDSWRHPGW